MNATTMNSTSPNTALILGANGRFGQAAVQAFAQAGWRVLAQMRRPPGMPLPAGAEALTMALDDTAGLAAAAHGAQVVVYAVNPLYTRWSAELLPLFRQGLRVAQALGATLMLPGNVYNYGSQLPARLTEDTPAHADHQKAHLRVAMEAELQRAAEAGSLKGVVIRAGDFYGCGSGSWLDQAIVKDIAKGKLVYPGPQDLPHAWAYLPDLAAAFAAVAGLPRQPAFQALHFSGHTLTGRDLLQGIDEAAISLGLRPPSGFRVSGLPWGLMGVMGWFVPMLRELVRMRYLWMRPHALSGERLAQVARVAGPLPHTPVAVALRQALLDLGLGQATPLPGSAKALSSRRAAA